MNIRPFRQDWMEHLRSQMKASLQNPTNLSPVNSFSRAGIVGPDTDASQLAPISIVHGFGGIQSVSINGQTITPNFAVNSSAIVRVGANCDTPSQTITLAGVFLGQDGSPIYSDSLTFTSAAVAGWGGLYQGQATEAWWPTGGAIQMVVQVTAVSGGTWSINALFL